MLRYPVFKVFAGSLTTATSKVDLTASYALVGSAASIRELDEMNLLLREHANSENAVVKFYLAPDGSQPASSTGMYQLVTASTSAEIEVTVVQNTRQCYPLTGVSGRWLLLEAKGASSTGADLSAFLTAQERLGKGKSAIWANKLTIIGTTTELTTSYADIGNFVDIRGLSNLTLYLYNSVAGADPADVTVFIEKSNTQPSATTSLWPLDNTSGTILTFRALTQERSAHPLTGVSGSWLGIQAKSTGSGTAASITAYLTGIAQGV